MRWWLMQRLERTRSPATGRVHSVSGRVHRRLDAFTGRCGGPGRGGVQGTLAANVGRVLREHGVIFLLGALVSVRIICALKPA